VDGLRLDATHAIVDDSPVHLLRELAERVHGAAARPITVIAEDERNERLVVTPAAERGYSLDAVWADDLHHQLRRLAAGDREGYFASYTGTVKDVVATLRKGWFYEGEVPQHRGNPRGTPAEGIPPRRFVHCIQNHDQVGNRAFGDRLTDAVELPVYRALSALLLCSPYTPMLWMGQEWAASSPFLYFTDHPDALGRRVTEGRREEFRAFSAFADPAAREQIPDPQARETFVRSKLRWDEAEAMPRAGVLRLYRELLALRRGEPALREQDRDMFRVAALGEHALVLRRDAPAGEAFLLVVCFAAALRCEFAAVPAAHLPDGRAWCLYLATEETRFGGAGRWGELRDGALYLDAPGAVLLRG
jgi:maltooligosyltrehalose trehalohydrolase